MTMRSVDYENHNDRDIDSYYLEARIRLQDEF